MYEIPNKDQKICGFSRFTGRGGRGDISTQHSTVVDTADINQYRIVSYRIVSYRIVSYRIVSYRIVSYRIVSYRIVSYRIVSYRIVSYRKCARNKFDSQ